MNYKPRETTGLVIEEDKNAIKTLRNRLKNNTNHKSKKNLPHLEVWAEAIIRRIWQIAVTGDQDKLDDELYLVGIGAKTRIRDKLPQILGE